MVLYTNLEHLRSKIKFEKLIKEKKKVIIIAGRNVCSNCRSMFPIFEKISLIRKDIEIRDWDYDLNSADVIRDLPECRNFESLPFVVYFKNGQVVEATSGKQTGSRSGSQG